MSSDLEDEHDGISYPMCHFMLVCLVSKSAYFSRHARPSLSTYLPPPSPSLISVKFNTGDFYEKSVDKTQTLVNIRQKCRTLYVKMSVCVIVAGDIKSP